MKSTIQSVMPYLGDPNRCIRYNIMAYNADIDAAWEDINSTGGAINFLAGTGEHIHLDSSSAEDDPDKGGATPGTGAHEVTVYYLDTDGDIQHEHMATNGTATTSASTATDVAFVLGAYVTDAGTGLAAAGAITVRDASDSTTILTIPAGSTQAYSAAFQVPTGYRLDIAGIDAASCIYATGAAALAYLRILVSNWNEVAGTCVTTDSEHFLFSVNGGAHLDFVQPLRIPAGSKMRVQAYGAAGNQYVQVNLEAFLVKL